MFCLRNLFKRAVSFCCSPNEYNDNLEKQPMEQTNKFKNIYYDHYSGKSYHSAPIFDLQSNYMMRFNAPLQYYEFNNNNLTIIFFNEGHGTLHWKDRRVKIGTNRFIVTNPGEGWVYQNASEKYIDVLSLVVSRQALAQFKYYFESNNTTLLDSPFETYDEGTFYLETPLSANCFYSGQLLQKIHQLSTTDEFELTNAEELSNEILSQIAQEQLLGYKYASKIEVKKKATQLETFKRLLKAYEYIHDNISESITLEELSLVTSLSKFHLYYSFKAVYGKTPHQFINQLKMDKSLVYLKKGEHSISEISDLLGFSGLPVFSKLFKRTFGKAPSHFT